MSPDCLNCTMGGGRGGGARGAEREERLMSNREMNRGSDWQWEEEGGREGGARNAVRCGHCYGIWEGCTFDRKYY